MRLWCLLRRDTGYNIFVANPQLGPGSESMGMASWMSAWCLCTSVRCGLGPCMITVFEYRLCSINLKKYENNIFRETKEYPTSGYNYYIPNIELTCT